MKKFFAVLLILVLIVCSLCSCQPFNLMFWNRITILDDGVIYNDTLYNVAPKGFLYYQLEEEFVTTFLVKEYLYCNVYKALSPEFDSCLRYTVSLLGKKSTPVFYIFEEGTEFPNFKTVAIEDVVLISTNATNILTYSFNGIYNKDDLKAHPQADVVDKKYYNKDNKGDYCISSIIDFENPISDMKEIPNPCYSMYCFMVCTARDYETVYIGGYEILHANDELYVSSHLVVEDCYYKIFDEHQNSFKKALLENQYGNGIINLPEEQ